MNAVLDHGNVDQAEGLCQLLALQPRSEQGGYRYQTLPFPQRLASPAAEMGGSGNETRYKTLGLASYLSLLWANQIATNNE